MRRAFTVQLRPAPDVHNKFEVEACLYDGLADIIDGMLDIPIGSTSIRHDSGMINCYVGTKADKMRIVRERHCNALQWTSSETHAWCEQVVDEYRGSPRHAQDGNRLPRPVEESRTAKGNRGRAYHPDGELREQ